MAMRPASIIVNTRQLFSSRKKIFQRGVKKFIEMVVCIALDHYLHFTENKFVLYPEIKQAAESVFAKSAALASKAARSYRSIKRP